MASLPVEEETHVSVEEPAATATRGIRVTAQDLEHPEDTSVIELQEGQYVVIPVAPLYLDNSTLHGDGTVVLTLKRRS